MSTYRTLVGRGQVRWQDRLDATRRELISLVAKWREESRPRVPTGVARNLVAMASAMALRDPTPRTNRVHVLPYLETDEIPSARALRSLTLPALDLIRKLNLDNDLAPYTAGWWHGLGLAGCVSRYHGANEGRLRLWSGRPWVEEDLSRTPFPCTVGAADGRERRWVKCRAAWTRLNDEVGLDVLAGLLSGARRTECMVEKPDPACMRGTWLVVPKTAGVLRLLDFWRISFMPGLRGTLRISPFWGVTLSSLMPAACASSMLVAEAGGCPILPCAIFEVVWGSNPRAGYIMPTFAGEIPFICSHPTRIRRGWSHKHLKRVAALMGVASVAPEMRALFERWRPRNRVGA